MELLRTALLFIAVVGIDLIVLGWGSGVDVGKLVFFPAALALAAMEMRRWRLRMRAVHSGSRAPADMSPAVLAKRSHGR